MKQLMFLAMAGFIIATMLMVVGCGSNPNYEPDKATIVDVEVESFRASEEKWVKYTYWNSDTSEAYRQCKEGYYFHLDQGETVSEIIETASNSGDTIYYFKVKVAG